MNMPELDRDALKKVMTDCLEKREDGRYYATETGRVKLQAWFNENWPGPPPIRVVINDGRYEAANAAKGAGVVS